MYSDSQPLLSSGGGEEGIPVYYSADGIPISRAEVPVTVAQPINEHYGGNYQYNSWNQPDEFRRRDNVLYHRTEDDFFWWYCLCLFFWLLVLIVVIAVTSSVYDDDYFR